jgi:hypothetical protein
LDTTASTVAPSSTRDPAPGSVLITDPAGTVSENWRPATRRSSPASPSLAEACWTLRLITPGVEV